MCRMLGGVRQLNLEEFLATSLCGFASLFLVQSGTVSNWGLIHAKLVNVFHPFRFTGPVGTFGAIGPSLCTRNKTVRLRCFVLQTLPSPQVYPVGINGVWDYSMMPSKLRG